MSYIHFFINKYQKHVEPTDHGRKLGATGFSYPLNERTWRAYETLEEAHQAVIRDGGYIVKTVDIKYEVTEGDDGNTGRNKAGDVQA